jgi:Ca2+-binding RTX toxin-like protein
MSGGGGDDSYIVNHKNDQVIEKSGAGVDVALSSVTYKLGSNVENLILTGTSAINGSGNELVNTLIGNGRNNILNGGKNVDIYTWRQGQ